MLKDVYLLATQLFVLLRVSPDSYASTKWFIRACNSSFQSSDTFIWSMGTVCMCGAHTHTHMHMKSILRNKTFLFKRKSSYSNNMKLYKMKCAQWNKIRQSCLAVIPRGYILHLFLLCKNFSIWLHNAIFITSMLLSSLAFRFFSQE